MTPDNHTLTRVHINAFARLHTYNLKGAQSFYLDLTVSVQRLLNNVEHRGSEHLSLTRLQSALLYQDTSDLLYSYFSHQARPPFSFSFHAALGLNVNTSLGGTSIR